MQISGVLEEYILQKLPQAGKLDETNSHKTK